MGRYIITIQTVTDQDWTVIRQGTWDDLYRQMGAIMADLDGGITHARLTNLDTFKTTVQWSK